MKTILLATDGSDSATEALDFAVELCKETGASLEVVSVKPRLFSGRAGIGPAVLEIEETDGAEHIADVAAAKAVASGVHAHAHVGHGDPAVAIPPAGKQLKADLIVVGSRGLGAISGALLGSVSRKLAAGHADIPLTIVRSHTREHAHA